MGLEPGVPRLQALPYDHYTTLTFDTLFNFRPDVMDSADQYDSSVSSKSPDIPLLRTRYKQSTSSLGAPSTVSPDVSSPLPFLPDSPELFHVS